MILRQNAFGGTEKMLKGGLHCHTTRSDGRGTPEEVIRLHAAKGYDFLALTDHRIYNRRNFAPETNLTILPGMEVDAYLTDIAHGSRCFHTVCIGPDDETNGFAQDDTVEGGSVSCQQEYQPYLDQIHQKNNLTIYCHPEWSGTPARYFDQLQGNFAMEIWNSGSVIENSMDANAAYWDELLGEGIRIFGVATDDGHSMEHHGHGWVMVRSANHVPDILQALQQGAFYSTCGPVIRDFYVDNGVAHLSCEPCEQIQFLSDAHPTVVFRDNGITDAELDLEGNYGYVRCSIIDADGRRAWTNPIFLD